MKKFVSIGLFLLAALNTALVLLAVFSTKLQVPIWLNPVGRMHPLMLHLPIGSFIIAVLFYLFRSEIPEKTFGKISRVLWVFTAVTASLSALMGLLLLAEGGYAKELTGWHKWLGLGFALFCFFIAAFQHSSVLFQRRFFRSACYAFGLLLLIATGHFGAGLTHGEDFLFEAFKQKAPQKLNTEQPLYEIAIKPILEQKCYSCHNDDKQKGELNLASVAALKKGGKNGPIWVAGDALNSHILQMAALPLEDKKHMPPKGKPQLTQPELSLLSMWINAGADMAKKIAAYSDTSVLKQAVLAQFTPKVGKTYAFEALSKSDLEEVNTPFCSVFPIAHNSPALEAQFFVSQKFDPETLEGLKKARKQIVALSLAKMPVTDAELKLLADFENLERLNLNQTQITGKGLSALKKLTKLEELSLNMIPLGFAELQALVGQLKALKHLYVWETALNEANIKMLVQKFPNLSVNKGYRPDDGEKIKLNPPMLENKELVFAEKLKVSMKHLLPNVDIRYTLDGTEPDSVHSPLYSKPIEIDKGLTVRAIATKNGWLKSDELLRDFVQSTFVPDSAELSTSPNPRYMGNGAKGLKNKKLAGVDDLGDNEWLGYKDDNIRAFLYFNDPKPIKEFSISYLQNIGSYIFPPTEIRVWGGDDKQHLKLLSKMVLPPLGMQAAIAKKTGQAGGGKYQV